MDTHGLPSATCDYLVIGAGIVGLSIALELRRRHPGRRVVVLEKEQAVGEHASGRNSGVLHAGFYYAADSLKARLCRDGNRELRDYCKTLGLPLRECGKLVVTRDASELPRLDALYERGLANGVPLELLDAREAARIEPRAKTVERALFSPTTASGDPRAVLERMAMDARAAGIDLRLGAAFLRAAPAGVESRSGRVHAGCVVNAAGLYADRVAKSFGFGERYTILPFKGVYLCSDESPGVLRAHVYPVPDPAFPFLGVHLTVTVDGHEKIGPTALPALWREAYGGLARFRPLELLELALRDAALFLRAGFDFRAHAVRELRLQRRGALVREAARLIEGVRPERFRRWGRPGIRAQLLERRTQELVMDFVVEGDAKSVHVLNAVSPAWTCALPFARHVVDRMAELGAS